METPRPEARALYEALYPTAAAVVAQGAQHAPMLIIADSTGRAITVYCLAELDPEQRGRLLRTLAADCDRATIYAYIDEAWALDLTQGQTYSPDTRPLTHPDRVEVVIFTLFGRDWEASAYCPIRRPPSAAPHLEHAQLIESISIGNLSPHRRTATP